MLSLSVLDRDVLLKVLASCSVRDVLSLACANREFNKLLKDDEIWQQLAEQKWGRQVRELAQVQPGGWAAWTKHRLPACSSHPLSPLDLVQEHYQDCPWQHMAACLLCSRTAGGQVVREAIRLFLELYPTPTAVLDASDDSMLEVIQPLGLQAVRLAAVKGLAHGFLATDWQDPQEFKHCGRFVADSWRIFCRGHRSLRDIDDKNLQRWVRWALTGQTEDKQQRQRGAAGGGRKRKPEPPVEAGTLRSGRRRGGDGGSSAAGGGSAAGGSAAGGSAALPERRMTRGAAAAKATSRR